MNIIAYLMSLSVQIRLSWTSRECCDLWLQQKPLQSARCQHTLICRGIAMEQSQQETSGMCVCACSTVWLYPRDLWYPNLGFSLCLEAGMEKKKKTQKWYSQYSRWVCKVLLQIPDKRTSWITVNLTWPQGSVRDEVRGVDAWINHSISVRAGIHNPASLSVS